MDFCKEELIEWEQSLYDRNMKRMYKTSKNYGCPRKEALEDHRHNRGTKYIYHGECKEIRIQTNQRFRHWLKQNLYDEVYFSPVAHDYKTYGWISW